MCNTTARKLRGAFTLVELVVTLLVVGIVLAATTYAFSGFLGANDSSTGRVVLSTAELGLRSGVVTNNYAFGVAQALSEGKLAGVPVVAGASQSPATGDTPSDFTAGMSWPGSDQGTGSPPATSNTVGVAVADTQGKCYASIMRTVVSGEQKITVRSSWDIGTGECVVSDVCMANVFALPATQDEYENVNFSQPSCLLSFPELQ
jgi:prepilin-type N-terminal cleavage/methylation domain-containing protein